jgi:molybdenum cofactor cytidylyltransferase
VIAALLLAAGAARRFGAPKLLQDLRGKPLVRWSAEAWTGAVDEVVVVVPPDHRDLRDALAGLDVRYVVNESPERGIGSSIARGVASLAQDASAVMIALADEPWVDPHVTERVLEAWRTQTTMIVQPRFRGVPGHPVLFARAMFGELQTLTGDEGARAVVHRDPSRLAVLEVDAPEPADVDTPVDLDRLRAQYISSLQPHRS